MPAETDGPVRGTLRIRWKSCINNYSMLVTQAHTCTYTCTTHSQGQLPAHMQYVRVRTIHEYTGGGLHARVWQCAM